MLILTRGENERVMIGDDIVVEVTEIMDHQVRLGFRAPKDVKIFREELVRKGPPSRSRRTEMKNLIRFPFKEKMYSIFDDENGDMRVTVRDGDRWNPVNGVEMDDVIDYAEQEKLIEFDEPGGNQ